MNKSIFHSIVSPLNGSSPLQFDEDKITFPNNEVYQVIDGIPILLNEDSGLFLLKDILINRVTTQSLEHSKTSTFKNRIRKKILPSLTKDKYFQARYQELAKTTSGRVLILGSGDKVDYYKSLFPNCEVITSDVHRQFKPDIIFDAHHIPFKNATFNLVIAGQVLEHTMKPWVVASEIQRVLIPMGIAHIETPVNFPFHAHPYDFYRFTYTGLRSIFDRCKVQKSFVTEGNASTVALMNSELFINSFSNKYLRRVALFFSRFFWGWLKYFDNDFKDNVKNIRRLAIPKGIGFTFQFDGVQRTPKQLLEEYYSIASRK